MIKVLYVLLAGSLVSAIAGFAAADANLLGAETIYAGQSVANAAEPIAPLPQTSVNK